MVKTFSDETLRKALSLNLIELPDGIDNINEMNNNHRGALTMELIRKLKQVKKTETLINTIDIDNTNQRYYKKGIVFASIVLIFNFTFAVLIAFEVVDKTLGEILMSIVSVVYIIDTIVSMTKGIRNYFKMISKQVEQGTLMIDELYQRQFNYNN